MKRKENFYDAESHFSLNTLNNSPILTNKQSKLSSSRSNNSITSTNTLKRRHRTEISPRPNVSNFRVLITIMKSFNLNDVSIPINAGFHEPINYLQRTCEQLR